MHVGLQAPLVSKVPMALLTPLPYLLLQLIGFSATSFSFCYNSTMIGYSLFCSSISCPLSWSPLFLTPPQPSHGQVQPAGHVQSNFSLCCVLFQMPLAFLLLHVYNKNLLLNHTLGWSCLPFIQLYFRKFLRC